MRPRHGQISIAIYRRQTTYTRIWYTITDGTAVLMKVANRHSLWRDYAVKVIDKTRSSMEPFYVRSSKYISVHLSFLVWHEICHCTVDGFVHHLSVCLFLSVLLQKDLLHRQFWDAITTL